MFKIASLKLNGQDLVSAEWKRGLEGQLGQCGERQDAQLPVMVPSEPSIASSSEGQTKKIRYFSSPKSFGISSKSNNTLYIYQKRPISSFGSLWGGHFDQGKPDLKNPGSIGQITPPRTAAHRVHCATVKLCNCATVHLCSAYIQDSQIILNSVLCLIIWEAYMQRWTPADKIRFQICI